MAEQIHFEGENGGVIEAALSQPHRPRSEPPLVVIFHGFPSGAVRADQIGFDLPELGDRLATEMGCYAMCPRFRGCGESTGQFSLGGWVDDAQRSLLEMERRVPGAPLWVVGFGTGGAVGLTAAARTPSVQGAAVVATPADFDDWAENPEELLLHARKMGAVDDPDFPLDAEAWASELDELRAADAAVAFQQRPLLVLHGSEDQLVPQIDARAVADAHGGADLRVIAGAGHGLRHDPRAVSILLGWLDRHQER